MSVVGGVTMEEGEDSSPNFIKPFGAVVNFSIDFLASFGAIVQRAGRRNTELMTMPTMGLGSGASVGERSR